MAKTAVSSARSKAFRSLLIPVLGVIFFALVVVSLKGITESYSVLLGGLVWLVPNFYFVYRAFRMVPAKELIAGFYRAEVMKLILSAALFVAIIKILTVSSLLVLIAYLIAQFIFWIVLLISLGLNV